MKTPLFGSHARRKRTSNNKRLLFEHLEYRLALSSNPIITEFLASNAHNLADAEGKYPDWIEIYNPNTSSFDIGGWYLTDNASKLTKFQIPTGTSIAGGGYLVVFCDDGLTTHASGEIVTNFKLAAEGEYLGLVKSDGTTIISQYGTSTSNFPVQTTDVSYGLEMTTTYTPTTSTSNFSSNADGFTYADDIISSVGSGTLADGAWSSSAGKSGGGLSVTTTMSSSLTINGGFSKSLTIYTAGTYNISVDAKVELTSGSTYNLATTDTGTDYLIVKNASGTAVLTRTLVQAGNNTKTSTSAWTNLNGSVSLATGTYTVVLALKDSTRVTGTGPKYINAYFDNLTVPAFTAISTVGTTEEYFTIPTPGAANDIGLLGTIEDEVEFSVEHGLYTSPFSLTLACDMAGASIYYTTDGSTPTTSNGTLYNYNTGAITISKTTVVRAAAFKSGYVASDVSTQSYFFLADVVTQSSNGTAPSGWPAAGESVYGTYQGANRYFDYGMDPDIISTYGAGTVVSALESVPTVSLVTDLNNLFGASTGIITNSNQSGAAWQKAASIEYINPDGTTGFSSNVTIKIRGSASTDDSTITKYSFHVAFDSTLAYALFGGDGTDTFDNIDLAMTQNWSWSKDGDTNATLIRDSFSNATQGDEGDLYTRQKVVQLYIDGVYWGVYSIQEYVNADYAASYLGGSKDDYDVIKVNRDGWVYNPSSGQSSIEYSDEVTDGNMNAWTDLYNQMTGQFTVNYVVPTTTLATVADAENVLSDSSLQYYVLTGSASTINYINTGSDGHYSSSSAFPGLTTTTNVDNFIIEVQGTINISSTGNWTFGVSTSESFSFELTNGTNTYSFTYTGTGTVADVLRTFNVAAGDYNLRMVYVETTGGAELELFAAQGTYTTFNSSVFHLVGDTANGGIALPGMSSNVAYERVQGNNLNGTPNAHYDKLLDVQNLIDYMLTIFYTSNADAPISGWIWDDILVNGTWTWYPYVQPNNFRAVYNRNDPDGFKFILNDSEHTLNCSVAWNSWGEDLLNTDQPTYSPGNFPDGILDANPYQFHYKLTSNSEYLLAFADRVHELTTGNGALTDSANLARYDKLTAVWSTVIVAEAARWGDSKYDWSKYKGNTDYTSICTPATWNTAVAAERAKMTTRTEYFINQLKNYTTHTLYTATYLAPTTSLTEGTVAQNSVVTLANPTSLTGTIYYTVDGSDPRNFGGAVSSTAITYGSSITIAHSTQLKARIKYSNGTWSPLQDAEYYVNAEATSSNLAITEINYHPYAPTPAEIAAGYNDAEMFEFVELKNIGSTTVDISQISFTFGITWNAGYASDESYSLAPGDIVVVVSDAAAFAYRYGSGIPIVGVYSGHLSNSGEKLTLVNRSGQAISNVVYSDSGDWPGRADGNGSTLQIIDPAADPNDPHNWRSSVEYGGTPGADGMLSYDAVIINEVLTHTDTSSGDKIELYNTTNYAIDMSGWYLSDSSGDYKKYCIPEGTIITAHGYLVFTEEDFGMSPYALTTFSGNGDAKTEDSGATLHLEGSTFRKIALDYTVTANTTLTFEFYCTTTGSIQGIGIDNDDTASASSFFKLAGTTNWGIQTYRTGTTGSWVTVNISLGSLAGSMAYLVFGNYGSSSTDCLFRNVKLVETGGATTTIDFSKYFAFDAHQGDDAWLLTTDSSGNLQYFADHVDFGAAKNGVSFGRWPNGENDSVLYPMSSQTFGSANYGPATSDVVISEVFYSPGNNNYEFIEIYNTTTSAIDLSHWKLGGAVTFDFSTGSVTTLGAHQTLVIVENIDAFHSRFGTSPTIAGQYTGNLDDGGETLTLYSYDTPPADDPTFYPAIVEDQVKYDNASPWPVISDGQSLSLQRVAVDTWGNDATNWTAGTPTPGSYTVASKELIVDADDWATAGSSDLTLTIGTDGKLHVYITGATTDVVTPHLPAYITNISVTGRNNVDDVLTVDFSSGDPIPSGGVAFDGGSGDGNSLVIIGVSGIDNITMSDDQITVNDSEPIVYANTALFGFDLGTGTNTLTVDDATLTIYQANAISANTDVIVDGGVLDLNGHSDTIGELTLLSGSIVNGTLYAASYNIESGNVTAALAGPGAILKTTSGQAGVAVINNTNTTVEAGELAADSITTGTLTIGAGAVVTINAIPGGPTSTSVAVTLSNTATPTSSSIIAETALNADALTSSNTAAVTESNTDSATSSNTAAAPVQEQSATAGLETATTLAASDDLAPISLQEPLTESIAAVISNDGILTADSAPEPSFFSSSTIRPSETVAARSLPQSQVDWRFDAEASRRGAMEDHFSDQILETRLNVGKELLISSVQDELPLLRTHVKKQSGVVMQGEQKARNIALLSIVQDSQGKSFDEQLDLELHYYPHSRKQDKLPEKAVDAVLAWD